MIEGLRKSSFYREHPAQSFDFGEEKWAVFFLNMGGPETPDEVEQYLYNIFSDRNIISLPFSALMQKPLAKFISMRRAPKVAKRYQMIGGGSPLLKWSRLAASGVKRELSKKYPDVEVFVGMRYAEPFIKDELDAAIDEGCRHIVLFSMYPHYSKVTTGTALAQVIEWLEDKHPEITLSVIDRWSDDHRYIDLMRHKIDTAWQKLKNPEKAKLIFSAHAVPQKLVDAGDPYYHEVIKNVELAGEGYDYILTFQSRTGPVKWVGPDSLQTIIELGQAGLEEAVIVPISFVSDHIETLYEIVMQMKEAALKAGIKNFIRTESFNDDPNFAAFWAGLIEEKINA